MATVYVGSASIDENGQAHGGKAGNQSGKELRKKAYYVHTKGWRVFRANSPEVAAKIAECMSAAIANKHIGYDQYQRNTLYKAAEQYGFDVSKVTTNVECDCSALVRVCCAYAGITGLPEGFRTVNMPTNLKKTGAFTELTGDKYQRQSLYLGAGDILVTKTSGHTEVVLNNGAKYEGVVVTKTYTLGERTLVHGCTGDDVKALQEALLSLGFSLGKYGVDGDFGDCTELAVISFQKSRSLPADGKADAATIDALLAAVGNPQGSKPNARHVLINGGNCWVRTAPNTDGKKLGVVKRGTKLNYGGQSDETTGWLLVEYKPEGSETPVNGWVSGKYGKLIS